MIVLYYSKCRLRSQAVLVRLDPFGLDHKTHTSVHSVRSAAVGLVLCIFRLKDTEPLQDLIEPVIQGAVQLLDPLSGAEVMISDPEALSPLFPEGALSALPEDAAERFRRLSALPELRERLRLVPYTALGTERGLLLCFRPDSVVAGGRERASLVGLSPAPLRGDYNAIF